VNAKQVRALAEFVEALEEASRKTGVTVEGVEPTTAMQVFYDGDALPLRLRQVVHATDVWHYELGQS